MLRTRKVFILRMRLHKDKLSNIKLCVYTQNDTNTHIKRG